MSCASMIDRPGPRPERSSGNDQVGNSTGIFDRHQGGHVPPAGVSGGDTDAC